MFIISLTYIKPLEQVDALIEEHIAFLDNYYDKGIFLLSGRKEPRTGGVILAHNCSMAKLSKILSEDPFHEGGVAEYDVTEFIPSKASAECTGLL
ncbi:MAG: GTP cyclohydrolase [Kangiellaceae bacterium]|nr:GTP cyclohydrolase [Kangiellaceae bacterium]|tara:strand:- start:1298 stop:1582 length:285 start_codon:yes stop_codon:yes gene_type:complete